MAGIDLDSIFAEIEAETLQQEEEDNDSYARDFVERSPDNINPDSIDTHKQGEEGFLNTVGDLAINALEYIAEPESKNVEAAKRGTERNYFSDDSWIDPAETAESWWEGFKQGAHDSSSMFSKFLFTLTSGEQFVAKAAVSALANLDLMPMDKAKEMMSQSVLHNSDVMKFYWHPDPGEENDIFTARNMVGLGLDILFDPLMFVNAPLKATTKAGQTAKIVVGNTATEAAKLTQWQRNWNRFSQELAVIISSDNTHKTAKLNAKNKYKNMKTFLRISEQMRGETQQSAILMDQLRSSLLDQRKYKGLSPKAQELYQVAEKNLLGKKGLLREFGDGDRIWTLGMQVPWTNLGFEWRVPGQQYWVQMPASKMIKMMDSNMFHGSMAAIKNSPGFLYQPTKIMADTFLSVWSKTGHKLFDKQFIEARGGRMAKSRKLADWFNQKNTELTQMVDDPEELAKLRLAITDELEAGYSEGPMEFIQKLDSGEWVSATKMEQQVSQMEEGLAIADAGRKSHQDIWTDHRNSFEYSVRAPLKQIEGEVSPVVDSALNKIDIKNAKRIGDKDFVEPISDEIVRESFAAYMRSAVSSLMSSAESAPPAARGSLLGSSGAGRVTDAAQAINQYHLNILRKAVQQGAKLEDILDEWDYKDFLDVINRLEESPSLTKVSENHLRIMQALKAGNKTVSGKEIKGQSIPALTESVHQWVQSTKKLKPSITDMGYTSDDVARSRYLSKYPGAANIVKEIRAQNNQMLKEYHRRGIMLGHRGVNEKNGVRGYIKHVIHQDYIDHKNRIAEDMKILDEEIYQVTGKRVDVSAGKRLEAGTIKEINQRTLDELGVKMFVDDALEAHARRMQEMDDIVRNYDMMASAGHLVKYIRKGQRPELGYAKFDTKTILEKVSKTNRHYTDAGIKYTKTEFFPPTLKPVKRKDGEWIPTLPYAVNDRVFEEIMRPYNMANQSSFWKAMDQMNYIFYNNALFGFGYHGLNMMSNMVQLNTAGQVSPASMAKNMVRAWSLIANPMNPKTVKYKSFTGDMVEASSKNFWDELTKREVIGTGIMSLRWTDHLDDMRTVSELKDRGSFPLIDRIATEFMKDTKNLPEGIRKLIKPDPKAKTREIREGKEQLKSFAEMALMWKMNRFTAQFADDLAKVMIVFDRLDKGYTLDAAAEAAERYFYNYRNISNRMNKANKIVPFFTFPLKTMEMAVTDLGNMGNILIPEKVRRTIEGAYVEDSKTREALEVAWPDYKTRVNMMHGPLMPGMKQITMEMPWAMTTLTVFTDTEKGAQVHPFIKAAGAGLMAFMDKQQLPLLGDVNLARDLVDDIKRNPRVPFAVAKGLDDMIPPVIKQAFTLSEIRAGGDGKFDGYFSSRYGHGVPVGDSDPEIEDPQAAQFENDFKFGQYLEKTLGDNFLYNLIVGSDKFGAEVLNADTYQELDDQLGKEAQAIAARGKYIKSHFRQLTFGAATITGLDRDFFMKKGAIDRQRRELKKELRNTIAAKYGSVQNIMALIENRPEEETADIRALVNGYDLLTEKSKALVDYYDFVLETKQRQMDEKMPTDPFELIFGWNDYQFDFKSMGTEIRAWDAQVRGEMQSELTPHWKTRLDDIIE